MLCNKCHENLQGRYSGEPIGEASGQTTQLICYAEKLGRGHYKRMSVAPRNGFIRIMAPRPVVPTETIETIRLAWRGAAQEIESRDRVLTCAHSRPRPYFSPVADFRRAISAEKADEQDWM